MEEVRESLSLRERLLRRIPACHVDPTNPCPIDLDHFQPNKDRDKDGISLFRELKVSALALIASAKGTGRYYVACATVENLNKIGLNPEITFSSDHTSIPELRYEWVQANDEAATCKKQELAELMSKDFVLGPITSEEARRRLLSASGT